MLAINETGFEYKALTLSAGTKYRFYVQAHNAFDYSVESNTVLILCATKPNVPTAVTSANLANKVVIAWGLPADNGLPIESYGVFIQ